MQINQSYKNNEKATVFAKKDLQYPKSIKKSRLNFGN
jgi:hypothetical protein